MPSLKQSCLSALALAFFALVYSFDTYAAEAAQTRGTASSRLVETSPGVFYATILANGAFGDGSILKITSSGAFSLAHNFGSGGSTVDGISPQNIMLGPDGFLYGITSAGGNATLSCGTVFQFNAASAVLSTLHRFGPGEGCHAIGGLFFGFGQGGLRTLYGTTGSGPAHGTIYTLDSFGTLTTIHTFGSPGDGELPGSPLVVIDPLSGDLIGTTLQGGAFGFGTLYELRSGPGGLTESVVWSFSGVNTLNNQTPRGALAAGNDVVYGNIEGYGGTTNGSLFSFSFSNQFSTLVTIVPTFNHFGACSGAGIGSNGIVYGATCSGGSNGVGFIYKYDPQTSLYTVIHSFTVAEGTDPLTAPVLGSDGNLYGSTSMDGQFGLGTIYKMTPAGALTVLHSFTSTD